MTPRPPRRELTWDEAFVLGEERYRIGNHSEAAMIFARLIAVKPDDTAALRMLGMCRLRLGETAAALDLLAEARALAPDDPIARLHYGLGLHGSGRHTEAAAEFRASAVGLPDDPAPCLNLAVSLLADGDAELLEDLVAAAVNASLAKAREAAAQSLASLTGGLPLGLFGPQAEAPGGEEH